MTISDYQLEQTWIHRSAAKAQRAQAADEADRRARVRFVVEFAGTPRAGKTTALHGVRRYLESRGVKVSVVEEQAGSCPLDRKCHPDFNLWTASTTVARMLDAANCDADVVLVDRGRFDALCWIGWHVESGLAAREDEQAIDKFMRLGSLAEMTDLVVLMKVDPVEAVRRDVAVRPGRIVNEQMLQVINGAIGRIVEARGDDFQLVQVDTTRSDEASTLRSVIDALRKAGMPRPDMVKRGARVAADL